MPQTLLRSTFREDLRQHGPRGRFYFWKGEGPFISVTNALSNGVPKPALPRWAAKVVAEYTVANLQEIIDLTESMDEAELTSYLKNKPWRQRDKAADLGTAVHDLAEQWVTSGGQAEIPDDWSDLAKAKARQFIAFAETVKPTFWAVEAVVFNRQFMYAGALDFIMEIPGHGRQIVDVKTGSGVYAEAALQQTAYRYAEFIGVGDDEVDMPDVNGAMILHLTQTGWKLVPVVTDETSWHAFRASLWTAKWVTGDGPGTQREAIGATVLQGRAE